MILFSSEQRNHMIRVNISCFCIFAFLLFVIAILTSCSERSLELQLRYDDIFGLTEKEAVYFERNRVGQVENVSYRETGDYLVTISIDPDFKNAATDQSKFFIAADPRDEQKMAVIITQEQPGGTILQEGSIVEGTVKERYLEEIVRDFRKKADEMQSELNSTVEELRKKFDATSQQIDTELQDSIANLSTKLKELQEEAGEIPERQEVKELQDKFREFSDQFNRAQEDVRNYLRDTLLPKIRAELESLRELLKKSDREEELDNIDKQLDEISVV